MDYEKLAEELLRNMNTLRKCMPQKQISESLRGETFALQYIAEREGYVIPSEISNEMGISSARIAAALNSLENKGFVTRQIDPSDRRRILVQLTPAGREQARKHRQLMLSAMANMLAYLGEGDAEEYIRITGKLAEMPQSQTVEVRH